MSFFVFAFKEETVQSDKHFSLIILFIFHIELLFYHDFF